MISREDHEKLLRAQQEQNDERCARLTAEVQRMKLLLEQEQTRHEKTLEKETKKLKKALAKEQAKHEKTKEKFNALKKRKATTTAMQQQDDSSSSEPVAKVPRVEVTTLGLKNKSHIKWKEMFEELQLFHAAHGHCNLPSKSNDPTLQKLCTWVCTQRTQHRKLREGKPNTMTPDRIQLLDGLGFEWHVGPKMLCFQDRLAQLSEYQQVHGNCNVPQKNDDKSHPAGLGEFVLSMRRHYRQGKLAQERIVALENLGFQWSLRDRGGTLQERMERAAAEGR